MLGNAVAAEWLRTLAWWDWRGWSDWFYGGQAMGVNYPPLAHALARFTHPYHGQMAAVALGLLVLMPWGALRLTRACGGLARGRSAPLSEAVLVLTMFSRNLYWALSGFHVHHGFFNSWPAMVALGLGLHCAAWAASLRRPVACGVVAGLVVLTSASVAPGVGAVCAVLLITSGASLRQGLRWAGTAAASALAVCGWWLVGYLAAWQRVVRWDFSLASAWNFGGSWGALLAAALGAGALWAVRCGPRSVAAPRRGCGCRSGHRPCGRPLGPAAP